MESKGHEWVLAEFSQFEAGLNGERSSALHAARRSALEQFSRVGFPTTKNEEWRYTNVAEIARTQFVRPRAAIPTSAAVRELTGSALSKFHLVLVNGEFVASLSVFPGQNGLPEQSGVSVRSLSAALKEDPETGKHFSKYALPADRPFVALNTAFLKDGVVLKVAARTRLAEPVSIVSISTESDAASAVYPRVLILVEEQGELMVIEHFVGRHATETLSAPVTEIVAAERAQVDHYKIVEEGEKTYHLGAMQAQLGTQAQFRTHTFNFDGALIRNEISPVLDGERIECVLNGLSVASGSQHVDNHTVLDHAKPHCLSNELFKGIYSDRASGVFNGTIIVRPHAQKTNAIQSNQSLLLSDDATIDSKPQLKIWADDVKCTHGATVGQLDENALFYLRSRGVGAAEATQMLIQAFASAIAGEIRIPALRAYIESRLTQKLAAQGDALARVVQR